MAPTHPLTRIQPRNMQPFYKPPNTVNIASAQIQNLNLALPPPPPRLPLQHHRSLGFGALYIDEVPRAVKALSEDDLTFLLLARFPGCGWRG